MQEVVDIIEKVAEEKARRIMAEQAAEVQQKSQRWCDLNQRWKYGSGIIGYDWSYVVRLNRGLMYKLGWTGERTGHRG